MSTGWRAWAAVAVLLLGTALHHFRGYAHEDLSGHAAGSDDAYISYRYARSLAAGDGLTFNPGERVEGYSTLLFVLLIAPAFLVLRDTAIHPFAVALSAAFAAAAVVLLYRRLRAIDPGPAGTWGAALLAASPLLWLWTASGMETALVTLLQVALWAEVAGGGKRLPIVVVLLTLARADGFVGAGLAVAWLLARRDRRAIAAGVALAATMAALTAWRLAYYGWPLPNTYYAKVSGALADRLPAALAQLGDLALTAGLAVPLLILAASGVASLRARAIPFEPFFAAGWLGYWLYVGGDVFGERFLLVLVPLAIASLAREAAAGRRAAAVIGLGALALSLAAPLVADRRFEYSGGAKYDRWVAIGRLLASPEHRGKTVAVDAAGKIPFYSRLATIDMLGLNDAHIAHQPAPAFRVGHSKHDADYVLARRPELLATWVEDGLDLRWGLVRGRYEEAGYRLRYLAWTRRTPPGPAILDLRAVDPAEVPELVRRGYRYAVAERPSDQRTAAARDGFAAR